MRDVKAGRVFWMSLVVGLLGVAAGAAPARAQGWSTLDNQLGINLDTCLLLTDGTVMCLGSGTNQWHRLRPDANGSYLHGTWDAPGFTVAPMPNAVDAHTESIDGMGNHTPCNPCTYAPRFFGSVVLADGRVVVVGGEYNSNQTVVGTNPADGHVFTNIAFIYDPTTNAWSPQISEPSGGGSVGDTFSIVLSNGTALIAPTFGPNSADLESLDPVTRVFSVLGSTGKADSNFEEGIVLLPNGTLLVVDTKIEGVNQSESYFPLGSTVGTPNTWGNRQNTQVNLAGNGDGDVGGGGEIGPAVIRPDGKVVWFTGNALGQNAFYDTAVGMWSHNADADFPVDSASGFNFAVQDGPAAILPNGNVLVLAAPTSSTTAFQTPAHFFELRFSDDHLIMLDTSTEPSVLGAPVPSFVGRLLVLPTGEILFNTMDIPGSFIYSNGGAPQDAWRPVITIAPPHAAPGTTYPIAGRQFNGFSSGAMYGDDAQMATNYPLVRITNIATGHVFYARTHGHSSMGVQTVGSPTVVTTSFDTPAGIELGPSRLVVVTNGIPSAAVDINVSVNQPPVARCQNVPLFANAACQASVTSDQVNNGSSDPDGDQVNCTLNTTGPFGLGPHAVTLTCTDPSGASNQCTATVTVTDNTPPVITCPVSVNVMCTNAAGAVATFTTTATDNCSVSGPASCSPASGSNFPLGTSTDNCTVTDGSGNPATCSFNVTVALGDNPICCPAGTNIILGTSNNNVLNGTNGSDCILGRGGQDTINGNGGNDFISGGDGDDIISGGTGNDLIFGGTGQDRLTGDAGNDVMSGGDGDDQLFGGADNDTLLGGQGQDRLFGEAGNDKLIGETGDDHLDGGDGDDQLIGGGLHDVCIGGPGVDTFFTCETQTQ
jgi:Ca2+-binding RTX toxin-like protein